MPIQNRMVAFQKYIGSLNEIMEHAGLAEWFLLKPTPKFTLQKKDLLSASILLKTLNLLLPLNKAEIKD